ncbi:hypothetical protein CEXT_399881 [Caerostris extrusa]|uniref:Uncharacterized protein n=1 Tax=Caerostris extrusa TaxID=172846 RepID=A0AAV4NB27_CAEEX|nr:hypothetical protein CEXT_399881 [Caerostris extrusa]
MLKFTSSTGSDFKKRSLLSETKRGLFARVDEWLYFLLESNEGILDCKCPDKVCFALASQVRFRKASLFCHGTISHNEKRSIPSRPTPAAISTKPSPLSEEFYFLKFSLFFSPVVSISGDSSLSSLVDLCSFLLHYYFTFVKLKILNRCKGQILGLPPQSSHEDQHIFAWCPSVGHQVK